MPGGADVKRVSPEDVGTRCGSTDRAPLQRPFKSQSEGLIILFHFFLPPVSQVTFIKEILTMMLTLCEGLCHSQTHIYALTIRQRQARAAENMYHCHVFSSSPPRRPNCF